MNAPNQWELCAWRLVAQLALQGLPQWQGQDLLTFNAAVRELWTLESKPRNPDPFMTRCESFFATLRKHVPIGKLAEFDHLMQLAVRFRDRVPPDGCPIGASDEQIRSLARAVDQNEDGPILFHHLTQKEKSVDLESALCWIGENDFHNLQTGKRHAEVYPRIPEDGWNGWHRARLTVDPEKKKGGEDE